jgi:putative transposase
MARPRRLHVPGLSQHIIQRGNNRVDIFRTLSDRDAFLYALLLSSMRFGLDVNAYVLMTNHVHLIVTARSDGAVAKVMQDVGRRYVPYFNRRHQRSGSLFEGRYRSITIENENYWYTCMRYVETNPVRASMVAEPGKYRWSSYRTHAFGWVDPLLTPHHCYERLGPTPADRQVAWRAICACPLSEDEIADLRQSTLSRPVPGSDPKVRR